MYEHLLKTMQLMITEHAWQKLNLGSFNFGISKLLRARLYDTYVLPLRFLQATWYKIHSLKLGNTCIYWLAYTLKPKLKILFERRIVNILKTVFCFSNRENLTVFWTKVIRIMYKGNTTLIKKILFSCF